METICDRCGIAFDDSEAWTPMDGEFEGCTVCPTCEAELDSDTGTGTPSG